MLIIRRLRVAIEGSLGDPVAGDVVVPAHGAGGGFVNGGLPGGDLTDGLAELIGAELPGIEVQDLACVYPQRGQLAAGREVLFRGALGFMNVSTPETIAAPRASMPAATGVDLHRNRIAR